uniref:VWFA domain-containing protein n=1 Tax=Eptatretus burgeri TaxID=7764 RepID=A0A8C4QK26_EPTBU
MGHQHGHGHVHLIGQHHGHGHLIGHQHVHGHVHLIGQHHGHGHGHFHGHGHVHGHVHGGFNNGQVNVINIPGHGHVHGKVKPGFGVSKYTPKVHHDVDLVFVLDGSSKVTAEHTKVMKNLMISIIKTLKIGEDNTHVAMVVLGGDPRVAIPLGKFFKSKEIIDAVKHLKNTGGPRNFGKAFKLIASTVLTQGGGQRAGVDQVVISLCTGPSADNMLQPLHQLKSRGIRFLAIGAGYANQMNLKLLASASYHIWSSVNLQNVVGFHTNIAQQIYSTNYNGDVVFVVDASSSVSAADLKTIRSFLVGVAERTQLGPTTTRFFCGRIW